MRKTCTDAAVIRRKMEDLRDRARALGRDAGYPTFVWGVGNPASRTVLVGEAPGAQEVDEGAPFVGRSGQLLRQALADAGLPPDECWITNVVKHRPTRGNANRAPNSKEVAFWLPLLQEELSITGPERLLAVGGVAASALIPGFSGMNAWRGKWIELPSGVLAMATFHPSYVLRALSYRDEKVQEQFKTDLAEFAARVREMWESRLC